MVSRGFGSNEAMAEDGSAAGNEAEVYISTFRKFFTYYGVRSNYDVWLKCGAYVLSLRNFIIGWSISR